MPIPRPTLPRAVAVALVACLSGFVLPPAHAADQTVLGKLFVVKDPKPGVDPSLRRIIVLGKEPLSDDSIAGNPLTSGATVEIIANGNVSSDQVFTLPPGPSVGGSPGWKTIGNPVIGYGYRDAGGVNGPVQAAQIKKSPNGMFIAKVTIKGALGPGPQPHISVLPPAPGTDGGLRLTIIGADTYCMAFGGAAGGVVTNGPSFGPATSKFFKIVSTATAPTTEAGCPSPPTTTTVTTTTTTTTATSTTTTLFRVCCDFPPPLFGCVEGPAYGCSGHGTVAPSGSVCGASGTCQPPPGVPGPCCEVELTPGAGLVCAAGPTRQELQCTTLPLAVVYGSAVCGSDGKCHP